MTVHLIYKKSKNYPVPVCGKQSLHKTTYPEKATCKRCLDIYRGIEYRATSSFAQMEYTKKKLETEILQSLELLQKLIDDDGCVYVGGCCDTHHYDKPCPHTQGRELLKTYKYLFEKNT